MSELSAANVLPDGARRAHLPRGLLGRVEGAVRRAAAGLRVILRSHRASPLDVMDAVWVAPSADLGEVERRLAAWLRWMSKRNSTHARRRGMVLEDYDFVIQCYPYAGDDGDAVEVGIFWTPYEYTPRGGFDPDYGPHYADLRRCALGEDFTSAAHRPQ